MLDEPIRRRAPSEDLRVRRAAVAVVGPFNRKISEWQFEAAMLKARMISPHLRMEERQAARVHASSLSQDIAQQLSELEEAVAELPADVQSNTRIEDTFRALQQALSSLQRALATDATSAH